MENKFERIIENLEEEQTLTLGDQTFLNEMILDDKYKNDPFQKVRTEKNGSFLYLLFSSKRTFFLVLLHRILK
jgi:hypothetical protein